MYLIDTNVISEARKRANANRGVQDFFRRIVRERTPVFISVITVGELRRGVEWVRHRGDHRQAARLEKWLNALLREYQDVILDIDQDIAQLTEGVPPDGLVRVPYLPVHRGGDGLDVARDGKGSGRDGLHTEGGVIDPDLKRPPDDGG